MNRRSLLTGLCGLPFVSDHSRAEETKPYRISLLSGFPEGAQRVLGIDVNLDDGWKTYWRDPGDSGIPPSFDWSRSENIATAEFQFPLPERHNDTSGMSIGYFRKVVFPVLVTLKDPAKPALFDLDMFFGVCKEVCIPASYHSELEIGASSGNDADGQTLMHWLQKVPQPGELVSSVSYEKDNRGPLLLLGLKRPVRDIFVESAKGAFFHAPEAMEAKTARVPIGNIKDTTVLHGAEVRMTFDVDGIGLEQVLTLP